MINNLHIQKSEVEWLTSRKECITATEVSTLFGLNSFSSPQKIIDEKLNPTFLPNAFTITGQWLEDVVCKASNLALGSKFEVPKLEGKLFAKHPELKLGATPDAWGEISEDSKEIGLLECKSTRPETFVKYRQEAPRNYLLQLATQLMCTDVTTGYLAIMMTDLTQISPNLINPLVVYKFTRNKGLENLIRQEVNRFWNCQETNTKFRVDSKIKAAVLVLLADSVEKIYSISDESLELYFKNRVKIYSDIINANYTKIKSELEDLLS
jgi:predicted phage-related endonuclease